MITWHEIHLQETKPYKFSIITWLWYLLWAIYWVRLFEGFPIPVNRLGGSREVSSALMKLSAKWELSCSICHFSCKNFTCGSCGPVFLHAVLRLLQKRLLYHNFFKKCTRTSFLFKAQGMAQMQLWKQIYGEIQDRNAACMCSEQCSHGMKTVK